MSFENSLRLYKHYLSIGRQDLAENIRKDRDFIIEEPVIEEPVKKTKK